MTRRPVCMARRKDPPAVHTQGQSDQFPGIFGFTTRTKAKTKTKNSSRLYQALNSNRANDPMMVSWSGGGVEHFLYASVDNYSMLGQVDGDGTGGLQSAKQAVAEAHTVQFHDMWLSCPLTTFARWTVFRIIIEQ